MNLVPTVFAGPPAQKYPNVAEACPTIVWQAAMDITVAEQVAPELSASVLMAATFCVLAPMCDVKNPKGKVCPVASFSTIVSESGRGRSAAERIAFRVIKEVDAQRRREYQRDNESFESRLEGWSSINRALLKKQAAAVARGVGVDNVRYELAQHELTKPKKPRLRQYLRNQLTLAAFRAALTGFRRSITLSSDEGGVILTSEFIELVPLLCKAWDGDSIIVEKANHAGMAAEDPRVTLALMIQPGVLRRFTAKHDQFLRDSGFLARLLVLKPTIPQGPRVFENRSHDMLGVKLLHERMRKLIDKSERIEGGERVMLSFDDRASIRWFNYANEVEGYTQPGCCLHGAADIASKMMENITRVAAAFHAISTDDTVITVESLEGAWHYVWAHVDDLMGLFVVPKDFEYARALERHLHKRFVLAGEVKHLQTDLLQYGPECTRVAGPLHAAIFRLLADNKVTVGLEGKARALFINIPYFQSLPHWAA